MDELLGVLVEMLGSLFGPRRPRTGAAAPNPGPKTIVDRLRELSRAVAPPQPAPPRAAKPASAPAAPPVTVTPPPARGAAVHLPLPASPPGGVGPASAEGVAVAALFATPQSLVAAFIVSEVLAKPVALRDR